MRRIFVLFLILFASQAAFAQQGVLPYSLDANGIPRPSSTKNPLPTDPPPVSSFDSTVADLASPTVKYLQNIASFPAGSSIFFTSSAKVWYFPIDAGDTKTAAQVRLGGLSIDAGGQPPVFLLNTTADIAFVPDVTSASLTVFIGAK